MWNFFTDVFNPGGIGMGTYRTEFREIEAYARMTRQIILPQEAMLIRQLCELHMVVQAQKRKRNPKQPDAPPLENLTAMDDSKGLKAMFARYGGSKKTKPTEK